MNIRPFFHGKLDGNCVDRNIRDFDWKYIQDAVNTEVIMIKYGYYSEKWNYCESVDEILEHLLCDWKTLDGIWKHFEGKLKDANIKIKIL